MYRRIEQRYGFALPAEYRSMCARGWFDPKPEDECGPPFYHPDENWFLYIWDMKWLLLDSILEYVFTDDCLDGFMPFAESVCGDLWCWHPASTTEGRVPVVLCEHDSTMASFYAPDLHGAMYRQILAFATGYCKDAEDEALSRAHMRRWARDLGPVFPDAWRTTITQLATRPVQAWESRSFDRRGLLSAEECRIIEQRDLAFSRLDEEFPWRRE